MSEVKFSSDTGDVLGKTRHHDCFWNMEAMAPRLLIITSLLNVRQNSPISHRWTEQQQQQQSQLQVTTYSKINLENTKTPKHKYFTPWQRALFKLVLLGNSLAVQWLGLGVLTVRGRGSIPGRGTKIPQAQHCSQKKLALLYGKPERTRPRELSQNISWALHMGPHGTLQMSPWDR